MKRKHIPGWSGPSSKHPLYQRWAGIIQRCTNPRHHAWPRYGGAGVTICDAWLDFAQFVSDMGDPPSPNHSIDRIKNERGYEPGNCRWATYAEQSRNTRRNNNITVGDETLTVRDWEIKNGVKRGAYQRRIDLGWPSEKAVTMPIAPGKPLTSRTEQGSEK